MLTTFSGVNYKAFKSFDLTIKPLKILLGANSCGKSALINSLLMLSQTLDTSSVSESALRLNGSKVGMGAALNIVRDKNPESPLKLSFVFDDNKTTKKELDTLRKDVIEAHFMIIRFLGHILRPHKELYAKIQQLSEDLENIYVGNERFNVNQLNIIADKVCKVIAIYRKNKGELKKTRLGASSIQNFLDKTPLKKIHDGLTKMVSLSINKLAAQRIEYTFKYDKKNDLLKISEIKLLNKSDENIVTISAEKSNKISIKSGIIDVSIIRNSKKDIIEMLNLDSMFIFDLESYRYSPFMFFNDSENPVASFFSRMIHTSLKQMESEFSGLSINHVSPLRAFPQRYYLLDKSVHHTQLNALDGTELAEVLKKNPRIKDDINKLLAEFNIAVDVEKVNDIIHKITVNQDAVNLELTDVGFGISQVLPILVQAYLSPKNSITIIEQPEIHLHPKMQAWLTDALIKIALDGKKRFLIETHSDALVRRIRLRIVDDSNALTEDDVAIYHLEKNKRESCTLLNKILITPDGDISWPSDFMDVEIKDTLMIQQLKIQKSMKGNGVH